MLKINIPNNFVHERKYIIFVIIKEYLGMDYVLNVVSREQQSNYEIELENGKSLVVIDSFFNNFSEEQGYLHLNALPGTVDFFYKNGFADHSLPILFGRDELIVTDDKVICGLDIFASSFFMLTRWEEYVNKKRDIHQRFTFQDSIALINGFLHRPVVNEYVEMLGKMLQHLGVGQHRKKTHFKLIVTHDIDFLYLWRNTRSLFRKVAGDFIVRKDIKLAIEHIQNYLGVKYGNSEDPYDVFNWLMGESEQLNTRSKFYFMSNGSSIYDGSYTIEELKRSKIVRKITARNHVIGFHPSYDTYNCEEQWFLEKKLLEDSLQIRVFEGRQHYLRFEVPTTWQIWENGGMVVDSTCGFAEIEGYRCGTGNEYTVFNILSRTQLKLKERPLIYMDVSANPVDIRSKNPAGNLFKMIADAKALKMPLTVLFHNSTFEGKRNYIKLYGDLLKCAELQ